MEGRNVRDIQSYERNEKKVGDTARGGTRRGKDEIAPRGKRKDTTAPSRGSGMGTATDNNYRLIGRKTRGGVVKGGTRAEDERTVHPDKEGGGNSRWSQSSDSTADKINTNIETAGVTNSCRAGCSTPS